MGEKNPMTKEARNIKARIQAAGFSGFELVVSFVIGYLGTWVFHPYLPWPV